jgi:hypothetical protein
VLTFQDEDLVPFELDRGMIVPLVQMTGEELPEVELNVGDRTYTYERSYNIKGHSAIMPQRVRELMSEGKKPLVIERPTRYYLYVSS